MFIHEKRKVHKLLTFFCKVFKILKDLEAIMEKKSSHEDLQVRSDGILFFPMGFIMIYIPSKE